jgi:hypothetical protein
VVYGIEVYANLCQKKMGYEKKYYMKKIPRILEGLTNPENFFS